MSLLIKNAMIVNADKLYTKPQDILLDKGEIVKIASDIPTGQGKVIDAAGKLVFPGLIDLHVHLRQPGREMRRKFADYAAGFGICANGPIAFDSALSGSLFDQWRRNE